MNDDDDDNDDVDEEDDNDNNYLHSVLKSYIIVYNPN